MKKLFTFFFITTLSLGLCFAQTATSEYTFTGGSLENSVNATPFTQTGTALTFITGIENQASGAVSLNGDVLNNPGWISDNGAGDNDYSLAFWIKTSDNTATTKEIINHYTTYGWKFTLVNGNLSFYGKFYTAGTSASNQPAPHTYTYSGIADGEWHFIALTLDKSAFPAGGGAEYSRVRYKIYVDNVLKSNVEKQKVNVGNHYSVPNAQIYLGDNKDLNGVRYTDAIDNLRYYTGLLDAAAVSTLFDEFVDTVAPTAVAQDLTAQLDETGSVTIPAIDLDNGSSDNRTASGDLLFSLDKSTFDCTDLGANTVTLTVTDGSGNTANTTATITIEDTSVPTVITQDISVLLDADGLVSIQASDIDNGSSDNCGVDQMTLDITDFSCTNLGVNTVSLTLTDASGNESSGTATVTVADNTNPIAIAQDITVALDADGLATVSASELDNGSSDNCSVSSLALDITSFDCSMLGANTVSLTATDASDNSHTTSATVTIVDNTNPIVITQDIAISLDQSGTATITASDINNGSNDNCGVASVVADITSFDCSHVGSNNVTLTVTDNSGNSASATAIVTVTEAIAPTAITQDLTLYLDGDGLASITPEDINNGSSDNCAIDQMTLDITDFTCDNLGGNTVTLTVSDVSGNSSIATSTVTVEDNIDPVATAQDITVSLDEDGLATITASDVDDGSSDNCAIASTAIDVTQFDCSNIGPNTVTLTVTDASGNTSTATASVTIEDSSAPMATTQDISVTLDQNGMASITAADINNESSDNCGIANMELDIDAFDCSHVGENTVTLTITDGSGNASSATSLVTVTESVDPVAVAQDITITLDADGLASVLATDIDNGSSDNCAIDQMTLDVTNFTCDDLGANTVTLTVSDVSGNTSTATATVTVEDATAPTVVTQDITIELDASGAATITTADIDNGSSDNCAIDNMSIDLDTFSCGDLGANTVTLSTSDASGNTATASATVTVVDVIDPVVATQNIDLRLDAAGQATITTSDVDNGSSDNCSLTLTLDKSVFTSSDLGQNTVTLTGTDPSGNTATASAVVNVSPFQQAQTITFGTIPDQQYGVGVVLGATASSGLGVSYTVIEGPSSITFDQAFFSGIGVVTIEATQNGNDSFLPAAAVRQTFTVSPAVLTATANNQEITYGDAIPDLTGSITGFVNSEDAAVLISAPVGSTTATASSDAGVYPITVSGGSADNYTFNYVGAELTILKATATITLSDLEQEVDGSAKTPTIVTSPAGLSTTITYNGETAAPTTVGTYQVVVTIDDVNHEGSASGVFELIEPVLSHSQEITFEVYPNPTSDFVLVQSPLSEPTYILDLEGKTVLKSMTNRKIDVSGLSPGIYMIISGNMSERLIKR
ncbi:MAG: MBG domain-containing protein [Cyclobacteriaceae bacterium]